MVLGRRLLSHSLLRRLAPDPLDVCKPWVRCETGSGLKHPVYPVPGEMWPVRGGRMKLEDHGTATHYVHVGVFCRYSVAIQRSQPPSPAQSSMVMRSSSALIHLMRRMAPMACWGLQCRRQDSDLRLVWLAAQHRPQPRFIGRTRDECVCSP
jgi:hypothetical protein